MRIPHLPRWLAIILLTLCGASASLAQAAQPQSQLGEQTSIATAFNFQGQLRNSAGDVNGTCDFKFTLYPVATSGSPISNKLFRTSVSVVSGRFATALDFGNAFTGDPRWIETAVRCPAGNGNYTALTPRQEVLPAPYSVTAGNVANSGSAQGDFTVKGILKSLRGVPNAEAGIIQLENTLTGSRWQLHVGSNDDKLYLGFFDQQNTWSHVATFDRNSGWLVPKDMYLTGKFTSNVITTGVLRSSRGQPGTDNNGGILELESLVTNNKWHIHIPRDGNDLEFLFFENNANATLGMALERNGNLHLSGDSLVLANTAKPSGLKWNTSTAAIGWAQGPGEWSKNAQAGDLVVRPDNNKQLILSSGAQDHPAAITIQASGLVNRSLLCLLKNAVCCWLLARSFSALSPYRSARRRQALIPSPASTLPAAGRAAAPATK